MARIRPVGDAYWPAGDDSTDETLLFIALKNGAGAGNSDSSTY